MLNEDFHIIEGDTLNQSWERFLREMSDISIFHSPQWIEVIQRTYSYHPVFFILDNKIGKTGLPVFEIRSPLTGIRGVSLPFSDYCYPLTRNSEAVRRLIEKIIDWGAKRKWRYFLYNVRCRNDDVCPDVFWYYRHFIDLPGSENVMWKNLKDSTRRNIKKAIRNGLTVEFRKCLKSVEHFYEIYSKTRKIVQNRPPYPWKMIKNEYELLINKGFGFVLLVNYKGKFIAGGLFYCYGDTVMYRYGGSERSFLHVRPNDLFLWEAIRWAIKNGFKKFCFGVTDSDNVGLRRFKSNWGTKEEKVCFYKYNIVDSRYESKKPRANNLSKKVFKYMPVGLLKIVGNIAYPHIG